MKRILAVLSLTVVLPACGAKDTIQNPPNQQPPAATEDTSPGTCTPKCDGKVCGDDGCEGLCGECEGGQQCDAAGQCVGEACVPKCEGKSCGPDGCGGFCGACPTGKACNGVGRCTDGGGACVPKCDGKECGDDGCGSQCGKCHAGNTCTNGKCTAPPSQCGAVTEVGECQNDNTVAVTCKAGKLVSLKCSPENGLTCAYNQTKNKYDCIKAGCVPACTGKTCGSDGCGGQCGQCKPGDTCDATGKCQAGGACTPTCSGKVCGPNGCGGQCGTCGAGEKCTPEGKCASPECKPVCAGKQCGPDGCGGTCGTCKPGELCKTGACIPSVVGCTPKCAGKQCGPDGCGGECGTCPDGQGCDAGGHCVTSGGAGCGDLTFEGTCEDKTVKWCEGDEVKTQDCAKYGAEYVCAWVEADEYYWCLPKCQAACSGKACGDDGCGGSCGTCASGQTCDGAGQCKAAASPGCGDVTYEGLCEGNTLKYCAGDSVETFGCGEYGQTCGWLADYDFYGCVDPTDCTPNCLLPGGGAKVCGDDGCGNLCGVCGAGTSCTDGKCVAGGSQCGDVTLAGTCDGHTLKYCSGGTLYTQDCAAQGQTCGFNPDGNGGQGWYDCVDAAAGCGFTTSVGVCVGDVLQYCTLDTLTTQDCGSSGQVCLYDPALLGTGGYDCHADPGCSATCPSDQRCQIDGSCGCDGITTDGHCEGQTLVYCLGDSLTIQPCGASGKACNVSEQGYADCK